MSVDHAHGDHHAVMHTGSGPSYPFFKGAVIMGAVAGLLAGMAEANTFTRDLLPLIAWSVGGSILFAAIVGLLGWLIDKARHRRGLSLT